MSLSRKNIKKNQQLSGDELVQKIFEDFDDFKGGPGDAKTLGKSTWDMIVAARIAQLGKENASATVKKQISEDTRHMALSWDVDDARLSTTQKLFNRLAAGRYVDAINLAESSINEKARTLKTIMQSTGKKGGEKKNQESTATIKKAIEYYTANQTKWQGRGRKKSAAWELVDKFPPIKFATYQKHLKSLP